MIENNTKPQPVLVLGAITTFLTVMFGGLTAVAGLQENATLALICGVGMVVTGAINQAKDFYVRERVTPFQDTAAYRNIDGDIVAGPAAAEVPTNAPAAVVGEAVQS